MTIAYKAKAKAKPKITRKNANFDCTEAIIPFTELDSHRSIFKAAVCYNCPISAVPTNVKLLSEKRTHAKFQIDSLKTNGLVCIYTDGRTDG